MEARTSSKKMIGLFHTTPHTLTIFNIYLYVLLLLQPHQRMG